MRGLPRLGVAPLSAARGRRRGRGAAAGPTALGAAYQQVFRTSPRAREMLASRFTGVPLEVTALRRSSAGFKSWAGGTKSKAKMLERQASSAAAASTGTGSEPPSSSASRASSSSSYRDRVGNFQRMPSRPLSAPSTRSRRQYRKRFSRPVSARNPRSNGFSGAASALAPSTTALAGGRREYQRQDRPPHVDAVEQQRLPVSVSLNLRQGLHQRHRSRRRSSSPRPSSARVVSSKRRSVESPATRPKSARMPLTSSTSFHKTGQAARRRPSTARPASATTSSASISTTRAPLRRALRKGETKSSSF